MNRILVLVEGQTEERFVKDILNPAFEPKGLFLLPTIINTKVVKEGPNFKGGINSYIAIKKDLQKLCGDSNASVVTTMFDFYGLPRDFPYWSNNGSGYKKVEAAELAFAKDVNNQNFLPYLQLHEFEGLLFSVPEIISDALGRSAKDQLIKIRNAFATPEEINEGVETHPSKRLLKLFPGYRKPLYGSIIASRIGLERIRNNCPHFNEWVSKLLVL